MMKTTVSGILLLVLLVSGSAAQEHACKSEEAQLLARLEAVIPKEPAVATPEVIGLLEKAGATKRLDAAVLLIRALAFNLSTAGSNESKSLMEMIPAAAILKRQFGAPALPLLMYAGVSTDQEWLQKRIVLVIRGLGQDQEVSRARAAFSMKDSTRPAAKRFGELLDSRDLKIELADPARKALEDLDKKIRGDGR